MAETAAHMVDHVFPHVPVRQFVLSVPKRLRPFLHHRPKTATAVLHILLRALQTTLKEASPTAPATASMGAVSFLHRFGSSLNPHYHFHLAVVDGLFEIAGIDPEQGPETQNEGLQFHEATALSPQLLERLQHTARKRVLRHFRRHGLLEPHDAEDMLAWDHGGGSSSPGGCPPGPSQIRARRFPPLGSSVGESHGARAQISTPIRGCGNGCAR